MIDHCPAWRACRGVQEACRTYRTEGSASSREGAPSRRGGGGDWPGRRLGRLGADSGPRRRLRGAQWRRRNRCHSKAEPFEAHSGQSLETLLQVFGPAHVPNACERTRLRGGPMFLGGALIRGGRTPRQVFRAPWRSACSPRPQGGDTEAAPRPYTCAGGRAPRRLTRYPHARCSCVASRLASGGQWPVEGNSGASGYKSFLPTCMHIRPSRAMESKSIPLLRNGVEQTCSVAQWCRRHRYTVV